MPELRSITDTYVLQTKLENFGLSDGDGDLLIGLDAGDELIEVCFMLMTATAPERIQDLVLQGLTNIGDDAVALAAAQAALEVPAPIDPGDYDHNDFANRGVDDAHPHSAIAFSDTAATTLGTVVSKIEVFDSAGASLGFLPVYDAIT